MGNSVNETTVVSMAQEMAVRIWDTQGVNELVSWMWFMRLGRMTSDGGRNGVRDEWGSEQQSGAHVGQGGSDDGGGQSEWVKRL